MPASFWDDVRSDGGNIRVKTTGGTVIPHDIVRVDLVSEDGVIFFLASSILTGSDNDWHIVLESSETEKLAVDNANGRNAVWADYHGVWIFGETGGDDRTGNNSMGEIHNDPYLFEIDSISSTDLDSHNGVCWDGTYYYTTDSNAIYKWNSSWTLVDSNTDPVGDANLSGTPSPDHCGDLDVYNGKLYIPIEKYPFDSGHNAYITVWDADDLSFIEAFQIGNNVDELSGLCYCKEDGYLYGVNYKQDDDEIYKYDPSDGSVQTSISCDSNIYQRQGLTWWRGFFWVSGDAGDEVFRVSLSGEVSKGNLYGSGGLFGTTITGDMEGIGHTEEKLLVLVDPGDTERVDIWKPADYDMCAGGGVRSTGEGRILCSVSTLNVFTIGGSVSFASLGANKAFISYWDESSTSSNSFRVTLAFSNTNSSIGVWDTNNSWLLPNGPVNPSTDTFYRVHVTYNGTTNRTIQVNAASKNTDSGITQAPAGRDIIRIFSEDDSNAEITVGSVGFVYITEELLSDDWIQAEYDMLNDPSSFYSVEALGWTGKICGVTNPSKICGIHTEPYE